MEVDTSDIIPPDSNNGSRGGTTKKSTPLGKRKAYMHDDTSQLSERKKKEMRIRLSLTKPSYVLALCSKPFRSEHRRRLQYLLRRLVNQQDWVGASGVISVYLKGTIKDSSILKNRFKFWALLEILKHVGNHSMNSKRITNLYDVWSKKIGSLKIQSMKTWAVESRRAVLLEFLLFHFMQGNAGEAYQLALCIEQEKVDIDPVSKMMLGLTFYELWYSSIPEEFQWRDLDQFDGQENSHTEGTSFSNEVRQSEWHNTVESHMADSQYQCHSDSSVMNNRQMSKDVGLNNDIIVPMDVNGNHKREKLHQIFQPQDFYLTSDENQVTGDPLSNSGGLTQDVLNALGRLDLCLLPLRFENLNGLLEFMIMHRNQFNEYYNNALEYLELALNSTSFASAALLPLVQLLLIGGQVNEALTLLEQQCDNSYSVLPIRLRVVLLEHFDRNNYLLIQSCYEDILKKDPTCCDSLAKLITMHQEDAEYNTWKVLAICFSKLSLHEEDILSTCSNQNDKVQGLQHSSSRESPKIFTEGISAKSWNLRCRWWLTKYFSNSKFESNIKTGDLRSLTYKAACALYMYGQEFSYTVKAYSHLEKENEKDLLLFLAEHKRNSYGIYNKNSKKAKCLR
ncbi:uncharacterized protein LOC127086273 isoform X2 [Lathyrus oleraceus]|uniref:uncharacterized protein LOC127086273 isoform X2 n=1 Tax=Pisum sativum TaxID=3888 RepID=UPI0021D2C557|nr:uncharacterized protein LOC127086273 isoform X2 [Pisum sativum]